MTQEQSQPTLPASDQPPPAAQFQFRFERFSAFVEEFTSTISLEGMFLKTREPRPVGTVVAFDIRLADGFQLIHGQGEVEWMRPDGLETDQPAGMGIRFQTLSDKGRELILKILEEHLKAGGQPFEVSDIPPGAAVNAPPQGSGERIGGVEFDAPWGAQLPDVPAEFLEEGDAESPADDVFALPEEQAADASAPDVFDMPVDDAFVEDDGAAFELEEVPEFEALDEEASFEGGVSLGDDGGFGQQQSLPGLEQLPAVGVAAPANADAADWDIQPVHDFDEESTLLGAEDDEPTLMGSDEPTLMSLRSAEPEASAEEASAEEPALAEVAPTPTEVLPLSADLPAQEDGSEMAGGLGFAEAVPENPFAAETFPEAPGFGEGDVSTPEHGVGEESGGEAAGWEAPEPVPSFVTPSPAAEADPFATDAVATTGFAPDSLATDSFETDSLATDSFETDSLATDSFETDSLAADISSQESGFEVEGGPAVGMGDSFLDPPGFTGESFASDPLPPATGTEPLPADDRFSSEFLPAESASASLAPTTFARESFDETVPEDHAPPASGVVEGGLVGPFQFEDYDLDGGAKGKERGVGFARFRKPLLALAAVALLAVIAVLARGPLFDLLGLGESEPVAMDTGGPPPMAGPPAASPSPSPSQDGAQQGGEETSLEDEGAPVAGLVENSGLEEADLGGETVLQEDAEISSEAADLPPPILPIPPPPTAAEPLERASAMAPSALAPSASTGTAREVLDISTQEARGGTLVVLTLDGEIGPGLARVDPIHWDAMKANLILGGIVESYHPATILVNSPVLEKIRFGVHPNEVWLVFDFAADQVQLDSLRIQGRSIEVLVRRR